MPSQTTLIPPVSAERGNVTPSSVTKEVPAIPSQLVIPAVPGEYYAYTAEFTKEQPVYALLKCKSNKARTIPTVRELGREANLLFLFNDSSQAQVCAIREANNKGLLDNSLRNELFGETWMSSVKITANDFYNLRSRKDVPSLVKVCRIACSKHMTSTTVCPETVIAMMTDAGKYGLFFVKRLTPTSIQIDACHILL